LSGYSDGPFSCVPVRWKDRLVQAIERVVAGWWNVLPENFNDVVGKVEFFPSLLDSFELG